MTEAARLSLDDLAQRCADETDKFTRREENDTQFCFELLRRALVDGVAEAFTRAYQIYERQVIVWVYSHSRFDQTGESADYFARIALSNFYFGVRGPKFAQFPSLPQALQYLKTCAHNAIMQYLRDQRPDRTAPLDSLSEAAHQPDLDMEMSADEIWKRVCAVLPDERDRRLARYAFFQNMKPRQIVEAHAQEWPSERDVSVALFRIRRVLRNDAELRRMLGREIGD
jgi:hypothetical protein